MAKLATYRAKRDFTKTSEPKGATSRRSGSSFVVQKHDASRLHYDFRLEMDGVLKSWAVAKGPSLVPGEKRLAVEVEDHPVDYGDFEGTIPEGQYGGGTVMLWDRGTWTPEGDPHEDYATGRLSFRLDGEKLRGTWHLIRMRHPREKRSSWLLIKGDDEHARGPDDPDILEEAPLSVKTGRSLDEIAGRKAAKKRAAKKKAQAAPSKAQARAKPSPQAGPMPDKVEPCLATLVEEVPTGPGWIHEVKWDGYRLLAFVADGRVRLVTRNGKDWTKRFPGIAGALSALPVESAILDGEAVMLDENGVSSFAALQQALSSETKGVASDAVFYAFDLLYRDGDDLRPLPLGERKARLAKLLAKSRKAGPVRYSEHRTQGGSMIRTVCRKGLEGVVSKRVDLPYRGGRNEDWVKTKCTDEQEFVIAGYVPSTAYENAIGSLVLGYYDKDRLAYAGRTGTGFTRDLARDLFRRLRPLRTDRPPFSGRLGAQQRRGVVWVRPELIGQVEFRGWTADGIVRHAAFKGLREDKDAKDVTREKRHALSASESGGAKTMSANGTAIAGIALTHPDRILWEDQGLTKQELAGFYVDIAEWLLPHLVDRPLTLIRCPSGAKKSCFVQRHSWAGLSDAVHRETVRDEGGEMDVLTVGDIRGVVALVQAGVLEMHVWGATLADLDRPDRLIFDLDPGEGVPWTRVVEGARAIRERLKAAGLESFVKTTGGKGVHVVAPLTPGAPWDEALRFSRGLAQAMAADEPDRYTTTSVKRERAGRIFIDYLRNNREASAVAPYSTRARPGAPVSTPVSWEELADVAPNGFTVRNLRKRLASLKQDPWADIGRLDQVLPAGGKASKRRA
ncbi:DNA ligase D [Microvirga thermotolerans]|uniref:DNA ligase (ATP) n=1 Tax=Microvirga thermotolerans TaxID=2651334 RepID=A0A5P9JVC3_9HYPH|nr:DNA ligase D [Microvirga thermotolerans]QFU16129.1 DNA ligase D [Microvirga thermotolerans]